MTDVEPQQHFDLAAAGLRADAADVDQSLEVLALKLELSLPDVCHVRRKRKRLLSRERQVKAINIKFSQSLLTLQRSRDGIFGMRVTWGQGRHSNSGMIGVAEWLQALEDELRAQARTSEDAKLALDRLLGS